MNPFENIVVVKATLVNNTPIADGLSLSTDSDSRPGDDSVYTTGARGYPAANCTCPQCGKVLSSPRSLTRHIHSHGRRLLAASGMPFVCGVCAKRFPRSGALAKHELSHQEFDFPLKHANFNVDSTNDVSGDEASAVTARWSCRSCGKNFSRRSGLRRHAAVHSETRAFKCGMCRRTFKHRASLERHEMSNGHSPVTAAINTSSSASNDLRSEARRMMKSQSSFSDTVMVQV